MNAVTTNDPGRLGGLLFPKSRNREKVSRNALMCCWETTCVEETMAQMKPEDGGLSRGCGRSKSCEDKDLRTGTTGRRRRARWRGAGKNSVARWYVIVPWGRKALPVKAFGRSRGLSQFLR